MDDLKTFFTTDNKSGYKTNEKWVYKNMLNLWERIAHKYNNFNISFKEKLYLYINNLDKPPICANSNCNNCVKFNCNLKNGYSKFCSINCLNKSEYHKNKIKENYIKKYGVKSHNQLDFIKEKKINTCRINYGVDNPMQSNEIKLKHKKILFEKYGVDTPMKIDSVIKSKKLLKINGLETNIKRMLERVNKKTLKFIDYKNDEIKFHCLKCDNSFHINSNLLNSRINNNSVICLNCNKNKSYSQSHSEISEFLKESKINFKEGDRKVLKRKEIDFLLTDHNIGIEFNGLYWHSDKYKDKNYHLNKTNECEKQNIQLIHIFEDEWKYKKEIVKSIIKSKLGIYDKKVYGRKCEVRELNGNALVRSFLENNHIQGFVGSSVKLGLFYEDELVSVMTFGKKRRSMGNKITVEGEYEMLRFCNKLNTTVIGGASKLLKYFVRYYNPKSIISFADRRYSNGNLYENLGFTFKIKTKPNYFYFKTNDLIRHYRFKYRKDILIKEGFDVNKTEFDIMNERGFFKIFDSGNKKFILYP